ncbi:hypothetical protein D3C85_1325280 [compost metagenome]
MQLAHRHSAQERADIINWIVKACSRFSLGNSLLEFIGERFQIIRYGLQHLSNPAVISAVHRRELRKCGLGFASVCKLVYARGQIAQVNAKQLLVFFQCTLFSCQGFKFSSAHALATQFNFRLLQLRH